MGDKRCRFSLLGLAAVSLAAFAGLSACMLHLRRELDRLEAVAASAIVADATEHDQLRGLVAESEGRSRGLREALADRLRKETRSAVAAESVVHGQQVTAERSQRRKDIEALMDRTANTFGLVGRDIGFLEQKLARVAAIEKKLLALEKTWLGHRCPEPCRCKHTPYPDRPIGPPVLPAPTKVMPSVVPLSSVYTIPYPWCYERPRR